MVWVAGAVTLAIILFTFRSPLESTVSTWLNSEEYNYGPIVPVLSALMIWRDLRRTDRPVKGQWVGVVITAFGLLLGLIEFLSQIHFPGQVGLFVSVIGLFVALQGAGRARAVWPGLIFLFFAMPLALAIQVKLTSALQLLSSQGAVALIRGVGLTVLREGNVIDLGLIKLQVAEACSGLRYLFPLATFTFLCAYLFISRPVTRIVIFLSSIPITIGMNILRIGATAMLVDRWGIELAEGFFHSFEGWIVFCLCLALLFIEMKLLCYVDGTNRSVISRLDFAIPGAPRRTVPGRRRWLPVGLTAVLSVGVIAAGMVIAERQGVALTRLPFDSFPRQIDAWRSVDAPIDQESLRALDATDYLSRNYTDASRELVNVWVAYYASQVSGNSAHSPEVCIPGGGWEIQKVEKISLPVDNGRASVVLPVNRLIISQGGQSQLVYYWFVEGGKVETNEYQAKVSLVLNALLRQRRDGALVRFVTPVAGGDLSAADERLKKFIGLFVRELPPYLPS